MTSADHSEQEPGGDDLVAAEYVLGVLPADERQETAARIEHDAAFARLVDAWEVHLSPMAAGYQPVEAPAVVKQAIDRQLFASGARQAAAESSPGLWQSLTFWRGLTALAAAAFVIAVAVSLMTPPPGVGPQQLVASVAPKDSQVQYVAVYDTATHELGLSHVAGDRPQGKDFELWVVQGQNPAVSLGVIPAGDKANIKISDEARQLLEAGNLLAISAEPSGGSPTGQPTGPIVAAGGLSAI